MQSGPLNLVLWRLNSHIKGIVCVNSKRMGKYETLLERNNIRKKKDTKYFEYDLLWYLFNNNTYVSFILL